MTKAQLYIDGNRREASNGARFDVIHPCDESVVGSAADATLKDVDAAVQAARHAFDSTTWSRDHAFRQHCLQQLQDAFRDNAAAIKDLQIAEAGSLCTGLQQQVDIPIAEMSHEIALTTEFGWEIDFPAYQRGPLRSLRRVRYEPRGVVVAITAWNAPFLLNLWKSVPALATGNTVVLKTAPDTPLSGALMARLIQEKTDIPAGVFNVLSSSSADVGDALTADSRVDMYHFTGSTAVGQRIASRAAIGLRKVVLELGGKSANILLGDADVDVAVAYSASLCMFNSGQGCTLPTRMIVHESIYDEVVERLRAVVGSMSWGDPRDPANMVGPIINARQVDRIAGLVDRAQQEGARVMVGGARGDRDGKGFWYLPTVLTDVNEDSELAQTEVFGPVLAVLKYRGDDNEAVRMANNSKYGLSGYVQTTDETRAWMVANQLSAGTVNIGRSVHSSPLTPFGGYGLSGVGREHGEEGWMEFLRTKTIASPAGNAV
jgi:aldehyde dehydrogenase (NAD+)